MDRRLSSFDHVLGNSAYFTSRKVNMARLVLPRICLDRLWRETSKTAWRALKEAMTLRGVWKGLNRPLGRAG